MALLEIIVVVIRFSLVVQGNWYSSPSKVKLAAVNETERQQYFGSSVAVDDTYLVVGATSANESNSDSGSITIFFKNSTGWEKIMKFLPPDEQPDLRFGSDVVIDNGTIIACGQNAYIYEADGKIGV